MTDRTELRIDRAVAQWSLLGVGIIALIVFLIALVVTPGGIFTPVHYISLVIAALGIAGWVMVDPQNLSKTLFGRTGQQAGISLLMTIAFIALIVAGYYILYDLTRTGKVSPWDLSAAQKYNLSETSIEILQSLNQDVRVYAFYNENDTAGRDEAELLLQQYARYANGHLTYEFVDPDLNTRLAEDLGGRQGVLVFAVGEEEDRHTSEAGFADESNLTNALVRVQLGEPSRAYFLVGHAERDPQDPGPEGLSEAQRALERSNFEVETLDLRQTGEIPADADLLIIAGPAGSYGQQEIDLIKAYLDAGGALLVMMDAGQGGGAQGLGVLAVDYSPDGSLLLTAGSDGTARIWDVDSATEVRSLAGHTSQVVDALFSPDGAQIVTAGYDGVVAVWDTESGEQVMQLTGEIAAVRRLAFSPDGRYLASAGADGFVNVWDAEANYAPVYEPLTFDVGLRALAFSPDGAQLAVGGGSTGQTTSPSGDLFIVDAATGETLVEKRVLHSQPIYDLAYTPDGDEVHTASLNGTIGSIDAESGEGGILTLYSDRSIVAFEIAEDGTEYYGLNDGTLRIRQPDAETPEGESAATEEAATEEPATQEAGTSEPGTQEAPPAAEGTETVLQGPAGTIWDVALRPRTGEPATSGSDGGVRIWNVETGEAQILGSLVTGDPLVTYLATEWGIQVNDDIIFDLWNASRIELITTTIITTYDPASPITQRLAERDAQVYMRDVRSVVAARNAPSDVTVTELALTIGPQSGQITSWAESNLLSTELSFDPPEDIPGPVSVAASSENAATKGRVVVFGDSDFAANYMLPETVIANADLLTSSVTWLSGTGSDIIIPPPNFTMATWDEPLTTIAMMVIQIAATCLAPLVMVTVGAAVWFIRRRRR